MLSDSPYRSPVGLDAHAIKNVNNVYWNLHTSKLYEEAIRRREGRLAHLGPLVVRTGQHTGRAPNDKFIVREAENEGQLWWGKVNRAMELDRFNALYRRLLAYLQGKDLFVQDCFVGADPVYRVPIRVITETAWHNLFARNVFIQAKREELPSFIPEYTIMSAPNFHAEPEIDGTRTEVFIAIHFSKKLILIGGTQYAGEIKKAVFTLMNYLLPMKGVLSMHCSANQGEQGEAAIFFGLSGTGKTTLSADVTRTLIGDDEHGWSESGIFNIEGGCYAKVIHLSPTAEPEIYNTTRKFGTILENVGIDSETGRLNLDDDSLTENTRAAYPISHIPHATRDGTGSHPKHIIMLTADAFGVLPPVARLSPAQAMYYFLSGYTARVAGTEKGVNEPSATFSACFGAPFLPLPPVVYANLLGAKLAKYGSRVWLINTGWTGGPHGVGHRMPISHTRKMIHAILNNQLENVPTREDVNFGVHIPEHCPGVPESILDPRSTWEDKEAYDSQARKVVNMFIENFIQFEKEVPEEIRNSSPH